MRLTTSALILTGALFAASADAGQLNFSGVLFENHDHGLTPVGYTCRTYGNRTSCYGDGLGGSSFGNSITCRTFGNRTSCY